MLKHKSASRNRTSRPFENAPAHLRHDPICLKPNRVAQVSDFKQTLHDRLRHTCYPGLRGDKSAAEVEVATPRKASNPKSSKVFDGVRLTSPDKVLWPDCGLTKSDLAAYFERHADLMLPFLKDRPLSIVRCPDGADGECFFQKHHNPSTPEDIEAVGIRDKNGKSSEYLVVRTKKGLVSTSQINALELHVWGCRADNIEKPERIVFDLDPGETVDFGAVRTAAVEVRDVLASLGLQSFAMLTGGKGIHVIAPIARRSSWGDVKAFSYGLASRLAETAPDRYVSNMSMKKRRGRIFVDYLRNERGSTTVCPFSPRRNPHATVATPISWRELGHIASAGAFTLETLDKRVASQRSDPWAGYALAAKQILSTSHLKWRWQANSLRS